MLPATRRYLKAAIGWCGLYLALAVLPLVIALIDQPIRSRSFWIEVSIGLGLVGFALLILQFALTARFRAIGKPFGVDTLLQFHRQGGLIAFAFVLAHPIVACIAQPRFLVFFDPRANFPRAFALSLVTLLLFAIIATTLWRKRFKLPYEWWRLAHGLAALLIVLIGLAHALQVAHYFEPLWKRMFWIAITVVAIALLVHARIIKPLRMRKKPWRVTSVRPERDSSWTVGVEPVGHSGFRYKPGQYAWLTINDSPFTLQQHPFSFSSSAESGKVEFTIKELGDFTSEISKLAPGTTAFPEGPYGGLTLEDEAPGAVFLAGGIGITPIMSILRTLRDRDDDRPLVLFYGNPDWENVTFREELDELKTQLNLKLIHIIEHPPDHWQGENGRINQNVIDRSLDEKAKRTFPFFVCGPPEMMNVVEMSLRKLGVPLSHIRSERFDIV